ncbi:hypothetical protein KPH14_012959 [Odynerus spinipes]|uniref:Uncharacterized protein n=1 Tax=Odynerus spinipes TaxID=1348599 RepID=A0AAD9VHF5_9HYME|nr:hypothetical protein KPH14_012959 [Odynerus spinipes]
MVFDPSTIKSEEDAKQFFTDFGLKMVDKIRTIDETMIVGGDIAAKTLVSGKLYENSIFGLPIAEDF